ncbi:MAG TPA: aldehyde dehydrogenase family protein, partial [Mycobacterium sp.]|nr:aldehyde dehydrogenase family protein [Mycobacterium sp.]
MPRPAQAFPSSAATSPPERAGYLKRTAEALQLRQAEIAALVSQEVGTPFAYSNVGPSRPTGAV